MGRSVTPTYRIEYEAEGWTLNRSVWQVRSNNARIPGNGTPSTKNIDKWVEAFESSMLHGCNRHLGFHRIIRATIRNQFTGEVVATWDRDTARPNEPRDQRVVKPENLISVVTI